MKGAPPLSKSFKRKTDAKRWIEDTKAAIRGGNAVSNQASTTTLKEALGRYEREECVPEKKKGWRRERDRVRTWMKHKLAFRFLSQLRGSDFAEYRDARAAEGKSGATIRLELMVISKLFKLAGRDWGIDGLRNPIKSMTLPKVNPGRERRLKPAEEKRLLVALRSSGAYMAELANLAIETAMRQGELLALTPADVDLDKRIARLRDTKNSEPRDVPLSPRAVEILRALPRPIKETDPLFPVPQDQVIRTFRAVCDDLGIEDLRFHDLRHEATTRLCARLPMHEAMRVTGHKTPSMLMRYYHPKAEDLARKLA
jgi:integrase